MTTTELKNALKSHNIGRATNDDRKFLDRVWTTDQAVYAERITALGFDGLQRVLDAGGGMGQWTLALAKHNTSVCSIDISPVRTSIASDIHRNLGILNAAFSVQSIEQLAFKSNSFDGIFCYSVIYMTDHIATLREFKRILKPGGKLYICGNGIGWHLRNLVLGSRGSNTRNARSSTLKTLSRSLALALGGNRKKGAEGLVTGNELERNLRALGFQQIMRGGEGTLRIKGSGSLPRFFRDRYWGLECVYEIHCTRGTDS